MLPFTPDLSATSAIALAIGLSVALLTYRWRFGRKGHLPLPPGPPGEPLIGHLRIIPKQRAEIQYAKWGKEYNTDILHFNVLGRSIIVLNSLEAAHDLLDKEFEIQGWNIVLTFLRWSPRCILHRKLLQTSFTPSACKAYRPIQVEEARRAAQAIATDPGSWPILLRQFSTAVVLRLAFGIQVKEKDDPYIKITYDAEEASGQSGIPAGTIVDYFPILRYLPSSIARMSKLFSPLLNARRTKEFVRRLHDVPWAETEPSLRAQGPTNSSFVHTHFGRYLANEAAGQPNEATIDDLKGAAAAIVIAGGNTTWTTTMTCLLGLLNNPAVRAKARAELEEVIGVDENGDLLRLPTFDDRPQLKYLSNVIHETTRWQPLSPFAVPHATLKDDEYKGYHIPAGSVVYANVKAMTRDERYYSSPEDFYPERYEPVAQGGRGEPLPNGPFGFGRRACPGDHLATSGMYIMIAILLATMHLKNPTDKDGNEIKPKVAFSDGISTVPEPFECIITPRSKRMEELLRG